MVVEHDMGFVETIADPSRCCIRAGTGGRFAFAVQANEQVIGVYLGRWERDVTGLRTESPLRRKSYSARGEL